MPITSIRVVSGSGQVTRRGELFGSRIVVRVFDEMGTWMEGELVDFSLPPSLSEPSGKFPDGGFYDTATTDAIGQAVSEVIRADDLDGAWLGTVSSVSVPAVTATFSLRNEALSVDDSSPALSMCEV
jgi:hypothetical protein